VTLRADSVTDGGSAFSRIADDDRGQFVLVAAAALALALFPLVIAYLQLGYAGDVAAEPTGTDAAADVDRALDRVVHDAAAAVDRGDHGTPAAAAAAFRERAAGDLDRLETARIEDGTAAGIAEAPGLADEWVADGGWRSGGAGDFAVPTTHGGVVVQERAGEHVVVAVALEVSVTSPDGTTERRVVVRVPG